MNSHDQIITWLRDAHAMEQSMERVLQRHAADAAEFPQLRERLETHLEETRNHAIRVRQCLEALDAQPSTMKSMAAGWMGAMEGMSTAMFQDNLVKNVIADHAMEHFEIACYSSLFAAAEEANLDDIVGTMSEILVEEEAMAEWLREQILGVTQAHLERMDARTL